MIKGCRGSKGRTGVAIQVSQDMEYNPYIAHDTGALVTSSSPTQHYSARLTSSTPHAAVRPMASKSPGCRMGCVMAKDSSSRTSPREPTSAQVTPGVVLKPSRLRGDGAGQGGYAGQG